MSEPYRMQSVACRAGLIAVLAIAATATPTLADPFIGKDWHAPMTFSFQSDSAGNEQIFGTGEIGQDTGVRLKSVLDQNHVKAGAIVILHSPGGDSDRGMEIGRLIRARSLDTRVGQRPQVREANHQIDGNDPFSADAGECDSACTLAFLGGLRRTVPPGSRYGIHDAFIPDNNLQGNIAFNAGQVTFGEMSAYVEAMGIDAEFMLFASRYDSSRGQVYYVPSNFLEKWHVTTSELRTRWEIAIRDGEFQLIGTNPNSSQFPHEHDELLLFCHGQPKRLLMSATYVTPTRSIATANLTPDAFAASVKQLKLVISKAQAGSPAPGVDDQSFTMAIAPGDVVEKPHAFNAHSVQAELAMTPAMVSFLQTAEELNFQFYLNDKDYYGFVVALPTVRSEIADFAAACK
jgi:hypothetical protein